MRGQIKIDKLSSFCKVIAGQSPKGSAYNENGIGVEFHQGKKAFGLHTIEPSNVWTTEITKLAQPGDILMSVRAPVGPTNFTDREVCIGRGLAAIRCKPDVLPQYILYVLKSIESKIVGKDGAVFNSISKDMIEDLPVPAVDKIEQQRIVDILDQEFAKIDALKANAEKSLQAAKDLFQAALKKELEPKEGWKAAQLKDIATIRPPKKEINALPLDLPVSFLPMEDLGVMDFDISPTQTKTLGELAGSYTYFADGDILLAKVTPCFENGKQGIARQLTNGIGFGSSEYIVYRPGQQVIAEFLFYFLATDEFHNRGKKQMLGACGLKRLAKEIAEQSIISFPDIEEQRKVATRIREVECKSKSLQENYQKTLALCDDLKQALLRKAFNGEL